MWLPGVMSFLQELESHCHSRAIVTFLDSDDDPLVIDLERQGKQVIYDEDWGIKELFIAKLLVSCNPFGSLILRSFTSEIDQVTQLPIQELRGYILKSKGNDLEFEKLPPNALFAYHNTDAQTGEPLPLQPGVRYC